MDLYTPLQWLIMYPLVMVLFLLLKNKLEQEYQRLQPGPPELPIIGNLHQLGSFPHRSLWQLSKKYGPVMFVRFGQVRTVVVSSAEAAREVLKVHDLACCSRPSLIGTRKLSYNYRDIAFAPYGDYWREMRKLAVLELFSLKRVQSFGYVREDEVSYLVDSISQSAASQTPVNLTRMLYRMFGSLVFRMTFGKTFRGSDLDNDRLQKMIHKAEDIIGTFSAEECFPYVGWIIDRVTGYQANTEHIFLELDAFFKQIINDHLKPGRKRDQDDIIDVLLKLQKDQPVNGLANLTQDDIKAVILNLFLGGINTGAITVNWAMAELCRKPSAMKKVQDEVRNSIGKKGMVTERNLGELRYLKMVVKETLRLHPPAPLLLPRATMSSFKINGHHVGPKTLIHINAWAIGRDPEYWNDPEDFCPERFLQSPVDFRGQHFELLPFGSGRRVCPGINMAIATVELALANLLYRFDWKLPNGMKENDMDMEETPGLTVYKRTALDLVPVNHLWWQPEEATS